jgi:hypothetical protein
MFNSQYVFQLAPDSGCVVELDVCSILQRYNPRILLATAITKSSTKYKVFVVHSPVKEADPPAIP